VAPTNEFSFRDPHKLRHVKRWMQSQLGRKKERKKGRKGGEGGGDSSISPLHQKTSYIMHQQILTELTSIYYKLYMHYNGKG